ncbi:MAG: hypothetical protein ACUVQ1_04730 [Candidatus Kapaibacteriales bacterium]
MNVSPINIYNKYEVQKENSPESLPRLINQNLQNSKIIPKQDLKNNRQDQLSLTLQNKNEIITKQERYFFVKLFPESAQKLENHILFNRNGRLLNGSLPKGAIIDARV